MSSSQPGLGYGKEAAEEDQEDQKPVIPGAGEGGGGYINIKVASQTLAEVFFHIKRDTKLRRLKDMYCGKHPLGPKTVVFLDAYGRQVRAPQTAEEVGLNDGDSIDVHLNQDGGFGHCTSVV